MVSLRSVGVALMGLLEKSSINTSDKYAKMFNRYSKLLLDINDNEANRIVEEVVSGYIEKHGFENFDYILRNYIKRGLDGFEGESKKSPEEYKREFEEIHGYYLRFVV